MPLRYGRVIKGGLAVVVVGFLVYYVDPDAMIAAARGADPWWIAAAVGLMPLNIFLEGAAWIILVRRADPRVSWSDGFGALLAGYALGFFTPARAGEFAGRAFYVRHHDKWEIAAVVAVQRLLDMAVAVTGGTIILVLFLATSDPPNFGVWASIAAAGSLIGLTLVGAGLRPGTAFRLARRVLPFRAVRERIRFLQRLSSRDGARILLIDLARFCTYTTQLTLLILALVPDAPFAAAYVGVGLVFLAKFLIPSFTLMDLGIREGAAVFFLGWMGFPEAAALNASLLLFGINLLLPAAVGVRFVLRMRLDRGSRSETEDADHEARMPHRSVERGR